VNKSRTKNALRNISAGVINKIIMLLFPFILRTVMIKTLGSEYLGLNSLFTSILQVLNLAELGFSSAVVYSMYKPLSIGDDKTICALMRLYRKIYRIIGLSIIICGLCLLPFLKYLISGSYPSDINIYLLFILYLINTSITYFVFAYKCVLLTANQRSDITSNVLTITSIIQYVFQIIILVYLKNYYLYIIVNILTNILNNIIIAIITNKKYPQYFCAGEIDNDLKLNIRKKVGGLLVQKICATTRNSFDSIFISAFLGLNMVTMYNNYYTIMAACLSVLVIISDAILAGVGDSIVTETKQKNYNDMCKFNFIYMWISGFVTICLACLYQPFMKIWMGDRFLLPNYIVILICIYFYILKMGDIRSTYSSGSGLWWEGRYRAIFESIANLVLNFILGKLFGLPGIILATIISLFTFNFIYSSKILFKHYFTNISAADYFKRNAFYAFVTIINCIIVYSICYYVNIGGIFGFCLKFLICLLVANVIYFLCYYKTKSFKLSKIFILNLFRRKKNEV